MPASLSRPPSSDAALAAYAELKARVRETLILGQQRIEAAKVITYWRTGWYIQTHIALQTTHAERYVQSQLQRTVRLRITTTKPDLWDRYLSDVFLTTTAGGEVFLNNRLLEIGHARLYTTVKPDDWEHTP